MDIRERVQVSDWVSGIGAIILLISVFLEWYKVSVMGFSAGGSGLDATKLCIIIILAALAAIAIVILRIADVDLDAIPVPMSFVMMGLGGISALIVILRILIHQKGLGVSYGIFISLVASAAVIVGGVLMQREEY